MTSAGTPCGEPRRDALVPKAGHEIRPNEDGSLDELVGWGFFHLEQMGRNAWWLGIDTEDGRSLHVNFHAKGKLTTTVEDEGPSDLWQRRFAAQAAAQGEEARKREEYITSCEEHESRQGAEITRLRAVVARLGAHLKKLQNTDCDEGCAMNAWDEETCALLAELPPSRTP